MPDAAIYVRLSRDRDDQTSTLRQEAECRAWAERQGLAVVEVLSDVGLSGYRDVDRPGFNAALRSLEAGRTLVVWKLDRLSRRGIGQVGAVLDGIEARGGRLVSVVDGIDTAQSSGRLLVAVLSELARGESASTSARVRSAKRLQLTQGRWLGGKAPLGYRLVTARGPSRERCLVDPSGPVGRLVQDSTAAPVVRELAQRATAGEPLRSLAAWLTGQGIPSYGGGPWKANVLAQLLRSPALAGWQPRNRTEVARDSEGQPVTVTDEPILSPGEYRALQVALDQRTNTTKGIKRGRRAPRRLLTGLLKCHTCDAPMYGNPSGYRCSTNSQSGIAGCCGTTVSAGPVDAWVADAALARVAALGPAEPVWEAVAYLWAGSVASEPQAERRALEAELADARARMVDLEDARYLRGEFKGADGVERYGRLRARLVADVESLAVQLESIKLPEPDWGLMTDPSALREAWEGADLALKRSILFTVVLQVSVRPASARGGRFDPMRLDVAYRGA